MPEGDSAGNRKANHSNIDKPGDICQNKEHPECLLTPFYNASTWTAESKATVKKQSSKKNTKKQHYIIMPI